MTKVILPPRTRARECLCGGSLPLLRLHTLENRHTNIHQQRLVLEGNKPSSFTVRCGPIKSLGWGLGVRLAGRNMGRGRRGRATATAIAALGVVFQGAGA